MSRWRSTARPCLARTFASPPTTGGHWFTLAEMETVTFFRWEYEDEATVRVLRPGGLAPGEHEVLLRVSARVAYIPAPFSGEMSRTVTIAA